MKIALCLSGQPRFIERAYPHIHNNLIVPNNADVFVHTWFDKEDVGKPFREDMPSWTNNPNNKINSDAEKLILDLYKPKSYKAEKQKSFYNSTWDVEPTFQKFGRTDRIYFLNSMHCMWYSIAQSNLLKEIYRLENDIVYDYVIRCRMDALIVRPLKCSELDPDILWVSHDRGNPNQIDDWFAVSRNEIMNVYNNCFYFMDFCYQICMERDGLASNENLIYVLAKIFNLKHHVIPNFKFEFVRPWN